MTDEPRITIEDIGGELGFRVRWAIREALAEFHVCEPESSEGDGKMFFKTNSIPSIETTDISKAKPHCDGHIKWDGCADVEFHDSHICGALNFKKRMALLRYLYIRAGELMSRPNGELNDPWGDDALPVMNPAKRAGRIIRYAGDWDGIGVPGDVD